MAAQKNLKKIVEKGISDLLEAKEEPSEGRMKALALGIKMCALNAKLEESDYGDFFRDDERDAGDKERKGKEPGAGKRANGAGIPGA